MEATSRRRKHFTQEKKRLIIKEQFDSSTSFGELMIFNIVNLAQLERKQTSERVAVNNHTRSLQGMLSGGGKELSGTKKKTLQSLLIKKRVRSKERFSQNIMLQSDFAKM